TTHTGIPHTLEGITLHTPTPDTPTTLRVRLTRTGPDSLSVTTALPDGTPYATIRRLTLRALSVPAAQAPVHRVDWAPRPAPSADDDLADCVCLGLADHPVAALLPTSRHYGSLEELSRTLDDGARAPRLLLADLTGDRDSGDRTVGESEEVHDGLDRALALLRTWLADERQTDTRLVLLTRHAMPVTPHEDPDPAQAALWGLMRSAQTEHPQRIVVIDLDTHPDTHTALPHALALALAEDEPQLAVRQGEIHTPRLTRLPAADLTEPADGLPWRLDLTRKGTFDGVSMVPCPEAVAPLTGGQVRVEVRAVGLNFRDVLVTLDMVPGQEGVIGEGAGVVTEVGPNVSGLAPGDRVMGMFSRGIGPVAVTERDMLVHMPDDWSFAQAAAAPVAYLTAYEALKGHVERGESLLVHTATGGVGMAALQLARHWGLEVYATAGPRKWQAMLDLGIDESHIASSRTLDFEEKFRAQTQGRGVDVVLNSLADEAIDASLRLLADGGRFIEMGKTDIRDAQQVRASHPGVDYRVYDLTQTAPERIHELLDELAPLFRNGRLTPPPVNTFGIHRVRQAMRHLSQARHIGKVVLTFPTAIDPEGTVLITGGTGVLAAHTARHLVTRHGARHLLLVSRSGAKAPGAADLAAELEERGATVTVAACDVTDRKALDRLLEGIPDQHPLRAVVHTAGVIDDATVTKLTGEQLAAVLRPKIDGAWNLHRATRHLDLDAFILYSSLSGTLGAAGQANYAAANAYLDALAQHRHARGLPATSLAWGLWADQSGMTGHLSEGDVARIARTGFPPLTTEDALGLLDAGLAAAEPAPVLARVATSALLSLARRDALPALLRGLVRTPLSRIPAAGRPRPASTAAGDAPSLEERLQGLDEQARYDHLLTLVRTTIATVLAHPDPHTINPHQPFKELGFDSLTTVQLRNHLTHTTGLHLPTTLAYDHPTPHQLTTHLHHQLTPHTTTNHTPTPPTTPTTTDEPIAIIGMACRYPGDITSPQQLWELVAQGRDAIDGFPTNRGWDLDTLFNDPTQPGTSATRYGGFLYDADQFDAAFFNISPREAKAIDPQQRLLLELAWQALEHAGLNPTHLADTPTGVYTGLSPNHYGTHADTDLEGHLLTGTSPAVASGRIAYTLGLTGPALTIDTA
ncbi:SDR family NAD(P)-dependent oxidoreductase, partial [Streptomyces sp. NPDC058796]